MNAFGLLMDALLPTACAVCSSPVEGGLICARCTAARAAPIEAPHPLSECRSLGPYHGALGRWLGHGVAGWGPFDAVVPVPTPWTRRVIRGFDHGRRLAHAVGRQVGAPMVPVLRHSGFARQVGRSAAERRGLADRAFVCDRFLPGMRALLVDDVMTTGATLQAAARALNAAGVQAVSGAVIAHAARQENNTEV